MKFAKLIKAKNNTTGDVLQDIYNKLKNWDKVFNFIRDKYGVDVYDYFDFQMMDEDFDSDNALDSEFGGKFNKFYEDDPYSFEQYIDTSEIEKQLSKKMRVNNTKNNPKLKNKIKKNTKSAKLIKADEKFSDSLYAKSVLQAESLTKKCGYDDAHVDFDLNKNKIKSIKVYKKNYPTINVYIDNEYYGNTVTISEISKGDIDINNYLEYLEKCNKAYECASAFKKEYIK